MGQMATQHADDAETESEHGGSGAVRATLLLTLELAQPAQGLFQALRDRHFPPERNVVPAHVSMFHTLPGEDQARIVRRLRQVTATRPRVRVEAPFLLGRGVGFRLAAPELLAIRSELARDWAPWLTPQDAQGYRPHITVQNKVTPDEAKRLLARLQQGFVPFSTEGVSLRLWRYLGGPWEALEIIELAPGD